MKVHNYDPSSGEFISTTDARPDPLEEGRFLVPGGATTIAPPALAPNEAAVWTGAAWSKVADFRGTEYWLSHDEAYTITELGETVPEGAHTTQPAPPPPAPAEIEATKVALVQEHMDAAARALRYDSIANAVTYAEEPAVARFQAEGRAFRAWRSLVWAACYGILEQVQLGERGVPTDEELLGELPELILPE